MNDTNTTLLIQLSQQVKQLSQQVEKLTGVIPQPKYISVSEVAELEKVSTETVRRWSHEGKLPRIIGRGRMIRKEYVQLRPKDGLTDALAQD